jgi:hypothetical protein
MYFRKTACEDGGLFSVTLDHEESKELTWRYHLRNCVVPKGERMITFVSETE